jgi:hypothetical protein
VRSRRRFDFARAAAFDLVTVTPSAPVALNSSLPAQYQLIGPHSDGFVRSLSAETLKN